MLHTSTAQQRRAAFQKRENDNRKRIETRQELVDSVQRDNLLMANASSDARVEHKRRQRQLQIEQTEKETLLQYIQDKFNEEMVEKQQQQEAELVVKLQKQHQEEQRDQRLRQQIKENSSELRELEKKLNNGYMNKERHLQIKQKLLLQKHSQKQNQLLQQEEKQKQKELEAEEFEIEKKSHLKQIKYNKELSSQVAENQSKKIKEYEQFLIEKKQIDQIIEDIKKEDQQAELIVLKKRKETKDFIQKFVKERAEYKQLQLEQARLENEKIQEYAKLQQDRDNELSFKKTMLEQSKNGIYEKLAKDMSSKETHKKELETLRIELAQELQESQARQKDRDLIAARIRKRLETIDAYHKQIRDKQFLQKQEQEEELVFRAKLMEKFAEDDRIEQMKQQQKRMKQLEHKRAVDKLVLERKRLEQERIKEEMKFEEHEKELEDYRVRVVEQERQRLLREHASKLTGFLPKGVLRDLKDLELFDQEFTNKFGSD